tara:strand:+ start:150 stop:386 length:237 start_codon:yes stop_codon:yes gene_type:complete
MRIFFIILIMLFAVGCTKVEISSGGTKVCTGQTTVDCSDNSNDGNDDNTSDDGDDGNTSDDGDEDNSTDDGDDDNSTN